MSQIKHYVRIRSVDSVHQVIINGETLVQSAPAESLLTNLYKAHVDDYPKFYKMDPLCRAGFVASELLLKAEKYGCLNNWINTDDSISEHPEIQYSESRGVVLFNTSSSLADDRNYQATINDPENTFPSPSLFVYTLPNVLTGEIAIRNRYYGETNFIVLPEFDSDTIAATIAMTFNDLLLQSLITGWVECFSDTDYNVLIFIVERSARGHKNELSQEIKILNNN